MCSFIDRIDTSTIFGYLLVRKITFLWVEREFVVLSVHLNKSSKKVKKVEFVVLSVCASAGREWG